MALSGAERQRRYRERHPEYQKDWYKQNQERVLEQQAEYRMNNKAKIAAKNARWYEENREEIIRRQAEYKRRNPHIGAASFQRMYAARGDEIRARGRISAQNRRIAMGDGVVTSEDWVQILDEYGHKCAYCDKGGPLEMDHIVPLARGGPHSPENIAPACSKCNRSKGAKLLAEWYGLVPVRRVC